MNLFHRIIKRAGISIVAMLMVLTMAFPLTTQAQFVVSAPVLETLKTTENISDKIEKALGEAFENLAAVTFTNSVSMFLNRIAQDTAMWIASGGEGQKPLIFSSDWGDYLQDAGEEALAQGVIDFAESVGLGDICVPPNIAIQIAIPVLEGPGPGAVKPRCTLDDLKKTWDVTDPKFLENFTLSFNTGQNDLSVAVNFLTTASQRRTEAERVAEEKRQQSAFRDIQDGVTDIIETPAFLVEKAAEGAFGDLKVGNLTFTGRPIADAINVFTKTLVSQYTQQLQSGFFSLADVFGGDAEDRRQQALSLFDPFATGLPGGQLADLQFSNLFRPDIRQVSAFDLVSEFETCPAEVRFASIYNCVIDSSFSQALRGNGDIGYMTVREAVNDGLLRGQWPFGFTDAAGTTEPSHENGYAYSNMKKLRRARIIPVGWELAALKAREVGRAVTLQDVLNEFDTVGSPFYHLVDPDWVLKAPALQCDALGPSQTLVQGSPNRAEICVDIKDCVVEDENGECLKYANCTNEARAWSFPAQQCDAIYETCEQYTDTTTRQTNVWIGQTLDPGPCNINNAGCTWYALTQNIAGEWESDNRVYLTSAARECESDDAGCHQYLRMNNGANLLKNSGFEDDGGHNYVLGSGNTVAFDGIPDGWRGVGADIDLVQDTQEGTFSVAVTPNGSASTSCLPRIQYETAIGTFEVGQTYTLSGLVRSESADEKALKVVFQNIPFTIQAVNDEWKSFAFQFVMPATSSSYSLALGANNNDCAELEIGSTVYYDAIKLERGFSASVYTAYGANNAVYLNDAPTCTVTEVGCQQYLPVGGAQSDVITAVATGQDVCPSECVGYNTFEQQPTSITDAKFENFIPESAATCSAELVGCQEYTNVDDLASGGESLSYFTDIRHCETPQPQCGNYFAWQGDDSTGFQLTSFSLFSDTPDGSGAPQTTDGSTSCDPADADCREFIAENGERYYRNISKTITCSESCTRFRGAANTVDQAECEAHLGTWEPNTQRCVYQVLESQSTSCSEQALGCYEYVGTTGLNIANIFADNFEDGDISGWSQGRPSTEAITVGGTSMKLGDTPNSLDVSTDIALPDVTAGDDYVVEFIAKSSVSDFVTVSAFLGTDKTQDTRLGGFVTNTTEWQQYTVGPITLRSAQDINFFIEATGTSSKPDDMSLFVDNIIIRRIPERYYLVRNSWNTPVTCETDPPLNGGNASRSMIGCQEYTAGVDTDETVYLKSFTRLCSEDKVGCEAVIDTFNSSVPYQEVYNEGTSDEVVVPADQTRYVVVRDEFSCAASAKGCMEVGKPQFDLTDSITGYEVTYLINDPDQYSQTLCKQDELFCREFTTSEGVAVFAKDPGVKQCELRDVPNAIPPRRAWYIVGEDEENPEECVSARTNSFVQQCPLDQVSCTQFFEPVTEDRYYYKKNTLIQSTSRECNGEVDWKQGCVLFNDTSNPNLQFKSTGEEDFVGAPEGCQNNDEGCDANVLLSVNLDRVCTEWIEPSTSGRLFDRSTSQYKEVAYALGRCIQADPENPTRCLVYDNDTDKPRLTSDVYAARDISWGSDDLSGYSIPGLYPVETLRQRTLRFDEEGNPQDPRLTKLSNPTDLCSTSDDCSNGQVCRSEFIGESAQFIGRCYDEEGIDGLLTIEAPLCRIYPEEDSPFPDNLARFADESDTDNAGAIISRDQFFAEANMAHKGQDAECNYQKISYGNGAVTRYYALTSTPPTTIVNNGNEMVIDEKQRYLGVEGFCLERDNSRLINGTTDEAACLSWYPVDFIQGSFDLLNSSENAGYLAPNDGEYYCAEATLAEYLTAGEFCGGCPSPFYDAYPQNSGTCDVPSFSEQALNEVLPAYAGGLGAAYFGFNPVAGFAAGLANSLSDGFGGGGLKEYTCVPKYGDGWYPLINVGNPTQGLMCTKLARVQDADSSNQAYTTRIQRESGYVLAELGFTYSQDNPPFGGGKLSFNPEELNQPLIFKDGDQFALTCNNCQQGVCQDSGKEGLRCPFSPNAGSPYSLSFPVSSFINNQYVPIRPDSEDPATANQPYGPNEDYEDGFRRLQNLYAKSYGVWQWSIGVESICIGTCGAGVHEGDACVSNAHCGETTPGISYQCSTPSQAEGTCVGGKNHSMTCSDNDDCVSDPDAQPFTCDVIDPNDISLGLACQDGPLKGLSCQTSDECNPDMSDGFCDKEERRCVGTDADGDLVYSYNSGELCANDAQCNEPGVCGQLICSNEAGTGRNSGLCDNKAAGDQCGPTDLGMEYRPISAADGASGWDIVEEDPSRAEPPTVRPVLVDSNSITGYAEGSEPGFTLNGQQAGSITADTSTLVASMSFYAYNDNGEQMPIRIVSIDWGDSSDPVFSKGSFKNRKNVCRRFCRDDSTIACTTDNDCETDENPEDICKPVNFGDSEDACMQDSRDAAVFYTYTHVYNCVGDFGDTCSYTPSLIVKDNWGATTRIVYDGQITVPAASDTITRSP